MKLPAKIYLAIAALGLFIAIAVPVVIYRSGSDAVPAWIAAVRPGPLSRAHAFLSNKCESCHTPNQGVAAAKCVTCHASASELMMKPATAFHANVGDCRGCHVEHQGAAKRPIKMDHAVLERVARRRAGRPVALDCKSCHTFKDRHQSLFGRECASCHLTDTWKVAGFLHPSPRTKECSQCHKAPPSHSMMHFKMVSQRVAGQRAPVEQCYACHTTDSWNNIAGQGFYDHH